eukprot:5461709-Amphidinium_carterae.1
MGLGTVPRDSQRQKLNLVAALTHSDMPHCVQPTSVVSILSTTDCQPLLYPSPPTLRSCDEISFFPETQHCRVRLYSVHSEKNQPFNAQSIPSVALVERFFACPIGGAMPFAMLYHCVWAQDKADAKDPDNQLQPQPDTHVGGSEVFVDLVSSLWVPYPDGGSHFKELKRLKGVSGSDPFREAASGTPCSITKLDTVADQLDGESEEAPQEAARLVDVNSHALVLCLFSATTRSLCHDYGFKLNALCHITGCQT